MRFLEYHYKGRGIVPAGVNPDLTIGSAVHRGVGWLLERARDGFGESDNLVLRLLNRVDEAVHVALDYFDSEAVGHGLDVEGEAEYIYQEGRAEVEALIRAWAKKQMPVLLEEYRPLEVEQEDVLRLCSKPHILFCARGDSLLLQEGTGDLHVYSLKTAKDYYAKTEECNEHDMQGISEPAVVEARLQRWALWSQANHEKKLPEWFREYRQSHPQPEIAAIKMEYLLKGRKEQDSEGRWVHRSPLIRGYKRTVEGIAEDQTEYAWSYYWTCSEPHPMRKSKWYPTGECEGGRRHRLTDDWKSFNVWEAMGIKRWLAMLDGLQPNAGDAIGSQIITPMPYFRDDKERAEWREVVLVQEIRVAEAVEEIQAVGASTSRLNRLFPATGKWTNRCEYPTTCPYKKYCFASEDVQKAPVECGLFRWREPNHEAEREAWQEQEERKAA